MGDDDVQGYYWEVADMNDDTVTIMRAIEERITRMEAGIYNDFEKLSAKLDKALDSSVSLDKRILDHDYRIKAVEDAAVGRGQRVGKVEDRVAILETKPMQTFQKVTWQVVSEVIRWAVVGGLGLLILFLRGR